MAEDFSLSELVIPGTYIRVRAEGLISAGGISSGNIAIVGTAAQGRDATHILSDYESAKTVFGPYAAGAKADATLPGNWSAAAVAGLISSVTPQTSPTNKVLSGVTRLAQRFSYGETKDLLSGGVLVLEDRQGIRVVRGITTDMAA